MSDMAQKCFNSWKEVFDVTNTEYLWCGLNVDCGWRKIKKY